MISQWLKKFKLAWKDLLFLLPIQAHGVDNSVLIFVWQAMAFLSTQCPHGLGVLNAIPESRCGVLILVWTIGIPEISGYSDCIRILTWLKLLEGELTTGILLNYWGWKELFYPLGLLSCYNVNLGKWEACNHHIERTSLRVNPTP